MFQSNLDGLLEIFIKNHCNLVWFLRFFFNVISALQPHLLSTKKLHLALSTPLLVTRCRSIFAVHFTAIQSLRSRCTMIRTRKWQMVPEKQFTSSLLRRLKCSRLTDVSRKMIMAVQTIRCNWNLQVGCTGSVDPYFDTSYSLDWLYNFIKLL